MLEKVAETRSKLNGLVCRMQWHALGYARDLKRELRKEKGQGTTEYAILVGVLVVIAILAITVFKPKIQELWNAISNGIQGL